MSNKLDIPKFHRMAKKIQEGRDRRTRVIEVTSCLGCPHFDNRWSEPPWSCGLDSCLELYSRNHKKVPKECPLQTKAEYLKMRK